MAPTHNSLLSDVADNPCLEQNWQPSCFASHMGPWMVEADWFGRAVAAVKSGVFVVAPRPKAQDDGEGGVVEQPAYQRTSDGIAIISAEGPLQKGWSKFGGTSTVAMRRAVRQAVGDAAVQAIMLLIDSPGGTISGTAELAADIATAARSKPIHAHVEDLAASAAYWLASQASRVTATATSQVGGIGTYCVLEDSSGQMAKEGIVVHVVAAGKFKGLGQEGRPISQEELDYVRGRVEALNEHFLAAVAAGRQMPMEAVRKVADGRIYIGAEAVRLGLIDAVENHDQAMAAIREAARSAKGISHMWNPVNALIHALAGTTDASAIDAAAGVAAIAPAAAAASPAAEGGAAAAAAGKKPSVAEAASASAAAPPTSPIADVPPAAVGAEPPAQAAAGGGRHDVVIEVTATDRATVEAEMKADLKRFTDAFGPAGAEWFAAGKTFDEAQTLHAGAVAADRDRLAAENAELKARVAVDRGSPTPVSFSPADSGGAGPQQDLAAKVGKNIARVAAGIKFAKKQ